MDRFQATPAGSGRRYVVDLRLTTAQIQAFYAGNVSQVSARDRRGVRIAFPIVSLRRFVDQGGISGTFAIDVDRHNRLQKIERL